VTLLVSIPSQDWRMEGTDRRIETILLLRPSCLLLIKNAGPLRHPYFGVLYFELWKPAIYIMP
jgi:hypothetical protein